MSLFGNMDIDDRFPIEWRTADTLSVCYINADKDLLKRAISNLIQNSINHNEADLFIRSSYTTILNANSTSIIIIINRRINHTTSFIMVYTVLNKVFLMISELHCQWLWVMQVSWQVQKTYQKLNEKKHLSL